MLRARIGMLRGGRRLGPVTVSMGLGVTDGAR